VPRLAFERLKDASCAVWIDADTMFFSSPASMFDEIGDASVGLSPHRFHEGTAHLWRCGTFNAGCVYWRNDPVGRRCLRDWGDDCLTWCLDQIDFGGRFMNQGYLNRWPKRYPEVHVIRHPGVNLAPWNIDGHAVEAHGDSVRIDGAPLVFYHFSLVEQDDAGRWYSRHPNPRRDLDVAMNRIYAPYIAGVEATQSAIAKGYPVEDTAPLRARAAEVHYIPLPGSRGA
jgi:hypothetical protein